MSEEKKDARTIKAEIVMHDGRACIRFTTEDNAVVNFRLDTLKSNGYNDQKKTFCRVLDALKAYGDIATAAECLRAIAENSVELSDGCDRETVIKAEWEAVADIIEKHAAGKPAADIKWTIRGVTKNTKITASDRNATIAMLERDNPAFVIICDKTKYTYELTADDRILGCSYIRDTAAEPWRPFKNYEMSYADAVLKEKSEEKVVKALKTIKKTGVSICEYNIYKNKKRVGMNWYTLTACTENTATIKIENEDGTFEKDLTWKAETVESITAEKERKAVERQAKKASKAEPVAVAVAKSAEPVAETTPEPVAESISYGTPARIIGGELTTAEKRVVARIMTEKICTVEDAENSYHLGYNNTLEITSKASGETTVKNFTIKIETGKPVAETTPEPVAESVEPVAETTPEPVAESVAEIAEKIKIREFWDVWDRHKSCLSLTEKNAIITMLTTGVAYYKDAEALYEIRKIYEPKQCKGFAYELKVYEERQLTRKGVDGKERKIFAGKTQKFEVNYPAKAFDRNGTLLEPMQKIRNKFFHTEWNRAREAADNGAALDDGQCLGELLREKGIVRLLDVAREYFSESIIVDNENHIKANRAYYKGPHVIKAENPKAVELLEKKIAAEKSELVFSREAYKAVNKLGEGILKEAALRPIWNAWKDIPDYHYTNSMTYNYGAREIKRLENRLKSIQKAQTKATENKPEKGEQAETAPIKDIASDWAEVWNKKATFGSVVFMEKTNGMRRLEAWWQFVPSKGRRIIMKSHNFKWDPNNKCWFVEWDGKPSPSLLKSYIDGLEESGMKIE